MHARSGGVAANVTCSIYTNFSTGLTSTVTFQAAMGANTTGYNTSGYLDSPYADDAGSMMMCQLGPKATLIHYTVHETWSTNTP
jgi:hypothetical protein